MRHLPFNPFSILLSLLLLNLLGCAGKQPTIPSPQILYHQSRLVMGTILQVSLCSDAPPSELFDQVFSIAQHHDNLLSNYRKDSDISRINTAPPGVAVKVHTDTFSFITKALQIQSDTQGLVNIAVGRELPEPWVDSASNNHAPPRNNSEPAFRLAPPSSVIRIQDVHLATGALGKGFALDAMIDHLREYGSSCALINFGQSSVAALGLPPNSTTWNLTLPIRNNSPLRFSLPPFFLSISQSINDAGQLHLVHPHSGSLITSDTTAVVISNSGFRAEGLSTADAITGDQSISIRIEEL